MAKKRFDSSRNQKTFVLRSDVPPPSERRLTTCAVASIGMLTAELALATPSYHRDATKWEEVKPPMKSRPGHSIVWSYGLRENPFSSSELAGRSLVRKRVRG